MRPKINVELAAVADEYASGGITWCERDVLRLISPYPPRAQVDRVLQNLGEDFYYDDVHCVTNGEDDTAVADGDEEAAEPSSDEDDGNDEPSEHVLAADTCEDVDGAEIVEFVGSRVKSAPLSACEADAVHKAKATMAALQATIENLRSIGAVRGVQCIEIELAKEKKESKRACQSIARSRGSFLAATQG